MEPNTETETNKYTKMPLWQYIVLYLVIGGAIYGLLYIFYMSKKGANIYGSATVGSVNSAYPSTTASPTPKPTDNPNSNSTTSDNPIITYKKYPRGGTYLTNPNGLTIYIFDRDTANVSNCTGSCAVTWPPFIATTDVQTTLPANISVFKRADGSMQYALNGKPLYYYYGDSSMGDLNGDGIGGIWHIVKQ